MSDSIPISTLADLTNRPITGGSIVSSSDHEAWRNDLESRVANLNDCVADMASQRAGTSAPTDNTTEGQIWADTTNDPVLWKGDPDGSGADVDFVIATHTQTLTNKTLTSPTLNSPTLVTVIKDATFNTGGTETHKLMGVIDINTTAVARSTAGVCMTYTLPANTLDANGKAIRITITGTKTTTTATWGAEFRFGTTPTARITETMPATDSVAWAYDILIVRVSSTACDISSRNTVNQTASPINADFNAATSDIDLTAAQTIDFNISSVNGSDTVTQELMMIEVLN